MQRRNGLFWGIFLLTFGVLFLARRAGWLDVNWHSLVDLWPVLLILAGVNLILERRGNPAAFVTTVMLAVAVPTTLFGFFAHDRDHDGFGIHWNQDDDNNDDANESSRDDDDDNESDYRSEREQRKSTTVQTNTFTESMEADTREAVFKMAGGAGRFVISDPTSELIKADTRQNIGSYSMSVDRDAVTHIPTIELKPKDDNQDFNLKDGKFESTLR